jgi:hypothetical protein
MVRRPDDGHVRTETYREHLFTGLIRMPDDGHVSTETFGELF